MPMTDVDTSLVRWRADTPGCAHRNHLNNAGAGLMPGAVLAAMERHLRLESEIGGYEAADAIATSVDATYNTLAALVHGAPHNMAIVGNATAGFIQSLSTVDFAPGDVLVTTRCDYTSNQIQYLALAQRRGVEIVHAADLPEGGVDPESVRALARHPRCRLVAVSWVPTNSGLVQDVAAVGEVCASLGVPYLVDACQAVGQIAIDVTRLHCDYLSVTARKFLRGPRGIGFMYVSDRALARGDFPLYVDMRGATWVGPDRFDLHPGARRFEDWEFPYALVQGLGAAARYALDVGVDRGGERARQLAASLREKLAVLDGVRLLDRGRDPCAIVTAEVQGARAGELVETLRARGINIGASLRWYGMLDFDQKGVQSALRLSPHYYNTTDELDAAVTAIEAARSGGARA